MSMFEIEPLMAALQIHSQNYKSYGDYSATTLISPPRVVALKKRYGHLTKVDPFADMASFIGTGVHEYFETTLRQYAALNHEYELERSVFDKFEDRLITGKFDILYQGEHIYDIKTTSVWKAIFDPTHDEWHQQQNIYAWLLGRRGIPIKSINIMAVYLDWKAGDAIRDHSYPQERVQAIPLQLWSPERTESYVRERVELHKSCEELPDDDLPACTPDERWERFPGGGTAQYALLKTRNAQRATRVAPTYEEIRRIAEEKNFPPGAVIEIRHAKRKRCEDYCKINKWCNHYRQYILDKENNNLNDYEEI